MNKPSFDIAGRELSTVDWLQCRLVIEISQQYFYYVVLEGTHTFITLKYYTFTINNYFELPSALESIFREDEVLRKKMKEQVVIYNWPENCLIPQKHFDAALNKNIIELLHGDLNKGMILSEKVFGWNMYNVYRIPPELHDLCEINFEGTRYYHFYSLWLECRHKKDSNFRDGVAVIFYPNEIVAAVFADEKLQCMQSLKFQTAEDIVWHLLNIYQVYHLDQHKTPLTVGGMIDLESAMYDVLQRYFSVIETELLPLELEGTESLKPFPPHFFSPLLKLAICGS